MHLDKRAAHLASKTGPAPSQQSQEVSLPPVRWPHRVLLPTGRERALNIPKQFIQLEGVTDRVHDGVFQH